VAQGHLAPRYGYIPRSHISENYRQRLIKYDKHDGTCKAYTAMCATVDFVQKFFVPYGQYSGCTYVIMLP